MYHNPRQLVEGDYGSHTWPCAPVLAQYVYQQREHVKGKYVLEVRVLVWCTDQVHYAIYALARVWVFSHR